MEQLQHILQNSEVYFFGKHRSKIKYMKKMSKKNLGGGIFQAITGHGLFGHHIRKWKKDIDQTCQCSQEEDMETAWHLWSEFPALTSIKQSIPQGKDVPMGVIAIQFFKTEPARDLMVLRTNNLLKIECKKRSAECPPCPTRMGTR